MKVVITGGSGFIGRRLASRLLERGSLADAGGEERKIDKVVLFDVVARDDEIARDSRVEQIAGDVTDPAAVARAIEGDTQSLFHFGAVVSAGAEADFDLGMRVNLDGTRNVLEACRRLPKPPRVIFASSEAVYGYRAAGIVDDDTPLYPKTSYGIAKACGELLVADYSRKGFIDGRSLRFPTIVVRPEPNAAASTFTSSIIREPLHGRSVVCPVGAESVMAIMSVGRVLEATVLAYGLATEALAGERSLLLPAVAATVREIVEAVGRAGGPEAARRIEIRPDPAIQQIVDSWPRAVAARRAESLGIGPDQGVDAIVADFMGRELK